MKKRNIFFMAGVGLLVLGTVLYFTLDSKWIGFISFMLGLISLLITLWQTYNDNQIREEYKNIIDNYKKKYDSELEKCKELQTDRELCNFEKSELQKFLDKINDTLQKENISKEELMKHISFSAKAIIFFKTSEDTTNKRALFMNKVYPELGVVPLRSGLSMLPPRRIPQNISNDKIIEWFKAEIDKRVPQDYEYNILFISVINMNDATSIITLQEFRKINFSFLDKIPIEELMIPPKEVMNYLHLKKNLSARDIIEIPNLVFLIEDYIVSKTDLEALRRNNDIILENVKKELKCEQLKTTDLATVDEVILINAMKNYVSEPELIAKRIKGNAIFWKSYFEHRQ